MENNFDIIIVGCGPTGAIASLTLSNMGLKVAVIEKNAKPYPLPRAIALNGFSMNIIKDILEEKWAEFNYTPAVEVGYVLSKEKMDEPFGKMQPPLIHNKLLDLDDYGFLNFFNQPQLEELLRIKITEKDNITTFFNHSALVMWESSNQNHIKIENLKNGNTRELTSKYLIGADGGGSFVRKQIGANLKTLGKAVHFLVVDVSAPRDALNEGKRFDAGGHQIIDPKGKRPTTFLICEGKNHGKYKKHFRFEFALNQNDDHSKIQSPDAIKKLISPYLNINKLKIDRSTIYKFNSLISTKWKVNNVFTVGDATHQTSPFIGQGLNMGIRNTFNLTSKIELVEKKISKAKILENYQTECYPDSEFIIKQSLFMGKMLFNIKPHINLLRSIVHFFNGKRGKPLDLFPAFVPKTITVPNGFNPKKSSQSGYPMYNYINEHGNPKSLRTFYSNKYRILCNKSAEKITDEITKITEILRPLLIVLSDGKNDEKTNDLFLVCSQRKEDQLMHKKLFKKADYVLMAPGYTMLGTYFFGDEKKIIKDYLSRFILN